jgi:DNA invertase Pin-like site-specific DNA recombinase
MATQDSSFCSTPPQSPNKALRVAIYARISTSNGSQSTDMQVRELREYAQRREFHIVKEYTDNGFSGSKDSRPALNQLRIDAGQRRFDAVLVWKLDRFARSLKNLVNALADFESLGIAFISLRDNLDLTTPSGRLMFQIVGAMAEFERALIQERVKAGLAHARAKGVRLGRRNTVVNTARVEILRGSGLSWGKVAAELGVSIPTIQKAMHAHAADAAAVPSATALTVLCSLREDA